MNKVIEMGRLTRDPEIRYSQGAEPICIARYMLAVDRKIRQEGQQNADFINFVAFGRQAEFAEKYMRQGMKMLITGRLQTGSYTNREGRKVYTVEVVAEEQEFAESKAAAAGSTGNAAGQQATPPPATDENGFMNIPDGIDEELPFS